jgi:hypothetical protein
VTRCFVQRQITLGHPPSLEPSVLDSYSEWAAYNQMTGTNFAATGDGIKNGTEFFSGTNPLITDTNPPPSITTTLVSTNRYCDRNRQ